MAATPRRTATDKPADPAEFSDGVGEDQPTDAVTDQVQAKVDEETEQGYRGVGVDETPNENYTVAGVVAGKPTPETKAD